jgi:anti-anti-sigma factor
LVEKVMSNQYAEYTEQNDLLIVAPNERFDTISAPIVEQEIVSRINQGLFNIIFNFNHTLYVSSAGLRVLLKTAKIAEQGGGTVIICHINKHIKQLLEISGFNSLLVTTSTLEKAKLACSKTVADSLE